MQRLNVRPDIYRVPDRAAWSGPIKPYPIDGCPDEAAQARVLIQSDMSTINANAAHEIQDEIHLLCDSVAAIAGADDSSLCFFDLEDGRFWIFPSSTAPATTAP